MADQKQTNSLPSQDEIKRRQMMSDFLAQQTLQGPKNGINNWGNAIGRLLSAYGVRKMNQGIESDLSNISKSNAEKANQRGELLTGGASPPQQVQESVTMDQVGTDPSGQPMNQMPMPTSSSGMSDTTQQAAQQVAQEDNETEEPPPQDEPLGQPSQSPLGQPPVAKKKDGVVNGKAVFGALQPEQLEEQRKNASQATPQPTSSPTKRLSDISLDDVRRSLAPYLNSENRDERAMGVEMLNQYVDSVLKSGLDAKKQMEVQEPSLEKQESQFGRSLSQTKDLSDLDRQSRENIAQGKLNVQLQEDKNAPELQRQQKIDEQDIKDSPGEIKSASDDIKSKSDVLNKIDQMDSLLDDISRKRSLLYSPLTGAKIQEFNALRNQLLFENRPSGVGRWTNFDFQLLKDTLAKASNDPDANRMLNNSMRSSVTMDRDSDSFKIEFLNATRNPSAYNNLYQKYVNDMGSVINPIDGKLKNNYMPMKEWFKKTSGGTIPLQEQQEETSQQR